MSTLKVNKLRDTAGSADAITLDPNGGAVLAGVTTVTSVKVGAAVTISESGIEATGVGITCANINGTQIGGRRNIIINGAMIVAQRGTSSTDSGYGSVDRFRVQHGGTDESPTQSQVDVASGTTPYTLGFRKALRITNGNQTGGAGATDSIHYEYYAEAQDIANSGWNYTSSSSFITLQFWIKSSVAQSFQGRVRTRQGTSQNYPFETGSLTADTWTKIVKTIPGNSNLQFDNDTAKNFQIDIYGFYGTDYTSSGVSLNAWAAYASGTQVKDNTSTWYTTNDATLEITGVQLEVGSQPTAFEHRSYGEEIALCKRYYNKVYDVEGQSGEKPFLLGTYLNSSELATVVQFDKMRGVPSLEVTNGSNKFMIRRDGASDNFDTFSMRYGTSTTAEIYVSSNVSGTAGQCGIIRGADTDVYMAFSAEL